MAWASPLGPTREVLLAQAADRLADEARAAAAVMPPSPFRDRLAAAAAEYEQVAHDVAVQAG